MSKRAGIAAGAAAGLMIVRERKARQGAERMAAGALETLLRAIDANDNETGRHVRRVAAYALILAEAADLDEHARSSIERVAIFHDIGKIHEALFDVVHEAEHLSPDERRAIAQHPELGARVLAPLAPFYPDLPEGVRSHHERWDGKGYPRGLEGAAIPLAARVVSIADTFDAVTHNRRYRHGRSAREGIDVVVQGRGSQFDPALVDLLLLPPVLDRFTHAHRELHAESHKPAERRRGTEESNVADVPFRWRESWLDDGDVERPPRRRR